MNSDANTVITRPTTRRERRRLGVPYLVITRLGGRVYTDKAINLEDAVTAQVIAANSLHIAMGGRANHVTR